MTYQLPNLSGVRAFEAAARHLSFTAAAAELNLTQAAVSHQVRQLERQLGFALFERPPRGLRLTDMGGLYLPSVRRAFEELATSTSGLFGAVRHRAITVRAPVSLAVLWIAPRLHRFTTAYPNVGVKLFSAIWADSLPDEQTDIDIRFGTGGWRGMSHELLFNAGARIVTPANAAPQGANDTVRVQEIARGPLIHVMGHEDLWQTAFRRAGLDAPTPPEGLRVDNSLTALQMVAAGTGAAVILTPYVEQALETQPIVTPIGWDLPIQPSHYLISPDRADPPKPEAVLFRDWLMAESAPLRES